jgi:hypothetical protein
MTRKHAAPEYQRNARTIRTQTKRQLGYGNPVPCWRCGQAIMPGMPFDVGHINPHAGHSLSNLAPEHRYRTGGCGGNRAIGGSQGAAITNSRRVTVEPADVETWPV